MSDAIKFDIPKSELVTKVWDYVRQMETQQTNKWCSCEWIVHPEDVDIPEGVCRTCGCDKGHRWHLDLTTMGGPPEGQHQFAGRRQRRGDTNAACAVHTKEGFILGFFEWLTTGAITPTKIEPVNSNRGG